MGLDSRIIFIECIRNSVIQFYKPPMTESLSFVDYAEMISILNDKTVQTLFNDNLLQDSFKANNAEDTKKSIHESNAIKSLLCDASLIKRIADIQLKLNTVSDKKEISEK